MNHLKIERFKCFEYADIHLNRLTALVGANGNGKSTVVQTLLLLRQTVEQCSILVEEKDLGYVINKKSKGLKIPLNGKFCLWLGNSSYVLNRNYDENIIKISLENGGQFLSFDYEADDQAPQLSLKLQSISHSKEYDFPILKKEFYYLNAERVGPRIRQSFQYFDFPNAGFQGEFVAQLISEKGGFIPVDKERHYSGTTNPGLEFQINSWLQNIIPGVKITVKQSAETQTAQVQIENFYTKGEPTVATNLGFGISYSLPIIATGLIAKKGSFFIVENPEAHLHPSAQSHIGEFLCMVADAGVNVIIETHSDHIINGIQLAVARKKIKKNDYVTINYFSDKKNNSQPNVTPISTNERGELSDWPSGFFDQTQIDYAELFKLRKG